MGLIEKLFGKTKRYAYEDYPNEYEQTVWVRDKGFHRLEFRTTPPEPEDYSYAWQRNEIKLKYRTRQEVKDA